MAPIDMCQVKYMTITLISGTSAIMCYLMALTSTHWIENSEETDKLVRLGISKVYWRKIMVNETMIGLGPKNSTHTRFPLFGTSDILTPTSFHVAQILFYACSISLGLFVICLYMHPWNADDSDEDQSTITNLRAIYGCCIVSALLGTTSLISFVVCSFNENWTAYGEQNYFGWSFYVANLSVASMWLASITTFADVLWQRQSIYLITQDIKEYELVDMKEQKDENETL